MLSVSVVDEEDEDLWSLLNQLPVAWKRCSTAWPGLSLTICMCGLACGLACGTFFLLFSNI